MDEAELLRRLDRVAGLQPPPESTERAMVRVRSALTTAPTPNRKLRMITRFGALAAAVAATLALGWWLFSPSAGNLAFADVQVKVKQTKTVTVLYTLDPGKGPAVVIKAIFLADGRARLEDPTGGGGYTTIDPKRERSLTVDPAAKQATLIRGYHHPGPTDIYRTMREIRNDEVQRFPPENVDGRTAEVFLAKLKGTDDFHPVPDEYKVYVDAATKLPFRLEGSLPGQNGEPGTRVRFELEFDQPLEEKLFSTEPPPGYTARTEGIDLPHKPTADPDKIAPTVTRDGIGPVNFGMTKKEVIEKLGEPDKIDQRGTALDYLSRGYGLLVSQQQGVVVIQG